MKNNDIAELCRELAETKLDLARALNGEIWNGYCLHCEETTTIERFYCGEDGDEVACRKCGKPWGYGRGDDIPF